jgi:hypothetical protein
MYRTDNLCLWLARHLPKRLVYWCYIQVATYATTGKHGNTVVPELSMMDALQRYEREQVNPHLYKGV